MDGAPQFNPIGALVDGMSKGGMSVEVKKRLPDGSLVNTGVVDSMLTLFMLKIYIVNIILKRFESIGCFKVSS